LGLGVHKSLIGGESNVPGSSDSFIGLRNLMKRIDCVRRAMNDWITHEVNEVCDTMGFQDRPKIKFNNDNLFDQPSYFKLLVELADRNIISNQTILEKIGEMWNIEKMRVKNESDLRKSGDVLDKLSPFIQTTIPDSNHKKAKELQQLRQEDVIAKEPLGKSGRPDGSKDTVTRKVKKRTRADKKDVQ
jgi:hypothetical protein